MFTTTYTTAAAKDLRKLPSNWRQRVVAKVAAVAADPHGSQPQVKPLKGRTDFRLRVGDWRVLFTLDPAAKRITVHRILHRKESYR